MLLKKNKHIIYVIASILGLILSVGTGLQSRALLSPLQSFPRLTNPAWADNNAIVLLAGGITAWKSENIFVTQSFAYSRQREAIRLYFNCKQQKKICKIIASGGDPSKKGISEAAVLARELQEFFVPAEDIIIEEKSSDTFENAQYSSQIIQNEKFENVVLVTSGIHMARSVLFFNQFDISVMPAPSDRLEPVMSYKHMAYNFVITDMAWHEFLGILWFKYFR